MASQRVTYSLESDVYNAFTTRCDALGMVPTHVVVGCMRAFADGSLKWFEGKPVPASFAPTQVSAGQTSPFAPTSSIKKKEDLMNPELLALKSGLDRGTVNDMRKAGRTDKQIMEYGEIRKLQDKEALAQRAAEEAAEEAAERAVEKERKSHFLIK